ncbi:MAG TPA: tandem-95 repeat protein [Caulobacterales bacterium]|nr:tandem-95 repeat protein [Caulobacterales bacterium]
MADSVFLAAQEISVGEADGQVLVTFKRAGDFSTPVTITYGVTDDTATNGVDYTAPAFGTATIPIGADHVSISIPIINDALGEATESFVVSIVGVDPDFLTHGIILAPRTARVSILDDENPVTPPVDPPLVSNFNVTLQPVSTGYELPIKLEFLPTNASQAVVGQKDGLIQVVDMATGTHLGVFLDLRGEVNAVQDRGLIDMAFSPDLQHNPYFYATFAVDPAGTAGNGLNGVDGSGNRFVHLVRYTLDAATNYTTIVANSAVTLVGNSGQTFADISGAGLQDFTNPTNSALVSSEKYIAAGQTPSTVVDGFKQNYWKIDSLSHIGGAIAFGADGKLYVSTGDGTSFDYADPRTPDVLNINSLSGKVLRLDPVTGQGLADNPFYTAGMSLDSNAAKVFQLGLRNPFAMGFSPDGQLFISNTGWNSWEMIENGPAGANFGWPYFEGGDGGVRIQTPVYKDFPTASAFYTQLANGQIVVTPAYRAFAHDSALPGYQVQAITAGDVIYSGDKYPAELTNDFFFADVVDGELYTVDVYNRQELQFLYKGADIGITDYKQGPDGYVYYVDLSHGIVGRLLITPKATGGLPAMTASGSATAIQGSAGEYTITNALDQLGGLMSNARIDLSQNFVITFEMNFGANDFGADGLGFVLHNDPRGAATIGWGGANLGLMSIANGLGIAFDTFQNADRGDIVSDSASFVDTDALTQTARIDLGNIEDGAYKTIVVSWNVATHTFSYSLNGVTIGTITDANFVQTNFGGSNFAYFGFTGATGGAFNTQSVRVDSVVATFEGAGGNHAPVAVNDVVGATVNTALVIAPATLLANDTDSDNNPLTLTAVSGATGGGVVLANGQITFTPTTGFTGAASFQYTVSDGVANAVGTVTVNVGAASTLPQLTVSGNATNPAADQYLLTNALNQLGGAMSAVRIDLRQNFTIGFDLNFGANAAGGDGMGFVLHNDPRGAATIGWGGANLGLMSIANGLGIAFDTYQNADRGDIVNDSASFADTDALTQTARIDLGNVEDGLAKHIVVSWNAATQTLSYTLNGVAIGTVTNAAFAQTYFGGSNFAYFGFTGATGGAFNTQTVKLTDLTATLEGGAPGATPVAVADTFATNEDAALPVSATRNVLTNDTDADTPNANLTAILDTTTAHGTLVLNAAGTFSYTPVANYNGVDTFTYHASDGAHSSPPVTVTINLAPINDPPVAVADALTAQLNTPLATPVATLLANDTDIDGNTLTLTAVSNAVNGAVALAGGQVTFTPTTGFVGAASFQYTVSDGVAAAQGTVAVTVQAASALPQLTLSGNATMPGADQYLLTPALTNQLGGAMSAVRLDLRQNFTIGFDMNFGANDAGADGMGFVLHNDPRGAATVGWGGANLGLMSIANGLGIAFDTYQNADRGDIAADSASWVDTDALTQTTRISLGNVEDGLAKHIVASWNAATQTLSYTLNGTAIGTLTNATFAATYFGGSNFVYFGFTGATGGAFNAQSVKLTDVIGTLEGAAPTNHPPTVVGETLATTTNTALVVSAASLLANDSDPDGDTLTLTAVSGPVNGVVALNAGQVTFTPTVGFNGAASFQYTVSDGKGGNTNGAATVNVTAPASGAPVAVNDAYTVNEDQTLASSAARNVLTNDTDPDTPKVNLTAVLDTTTAHGTLVLAAGGTFTYTPTANYFGTDTFTYHVGDGVNVSAQATATITVAPVNDPPVITYNGGNNATLSVLENMQHIVAQITVTDVDGTIPTYSLSGVDAGDFTIGANGALRFAAPPNFEAPADSDGNNQYNVTVKVTDTAAATDTINLTINVQDVAEGAVLLGTAGNDTNFRGTAGADIMQAGAGNDTVLGQGGNDVFLATVGDGNDSYTGGGGIDTIDFSAITAAATINLNTGAASSAQTGTDTLNTIENAIGGAGADTLIGTSAANRLSGGAGADVLTGGGGSDLFVFGPGFGADRITDFGDVSGNQDMVSFAGFLFTDMSAVVTHAAQVGADTVIDFGGGDILTLTNFQLSAFGPEDYFI